MKSRKLGKGISGVWGGGGGGGGELLLYPVHSAALDGNRRRISVGGEHEYLSHDSTENVVLKQGACSSESG